MNLKSSPQNARRHQGLAAELAEEQRAGAEKAAASAGLGEALSALERTMAEVLFCIVTTQGPSNLNQILI